jgi:superfamily II DNA or RNA helicase
MLLHKAAEVLDSLKLNHAILHGSVPGPERRKLLERFRDDPECRVFLSTDAGGTGLNLQSADTVINLEVPWNPAVLEQRIARVHRMGQHRPVQVFNLVMRDSIEERVLRVLEQKRSLFDELFTGHNDEIAFGALGQQAFLEGVRDLFAPAVTPPPEPGLNAAAPEAISGRSGPSTEASQALLQAGVQFLEALAASLSGPNAQVTTDARTGQPVLQVPLPTAQMLERGTQALQTILQTLGRHATAGSASAEN